ncbi:MAG: hypothetical protein IJ599_01315 [Alphaproteobacteria bacterium]|nr:hypothetical protein [Alphaproteobacteria bacterium]
MMPLSGNFDFYFLNFPSTKHLLAALNRCGIDGRFVGGCVRDAIMGKRTDDFDIAVNAGISTVQRSLELEGFKVIPTGLKYGSVTVIIDGVKFELTALRRDINCRGRKCDVAVTSDFEEDAKRRDFTMNALYVSQSGELFDYFGGVDDLKRGRVIFIGDPRERIKEDYLRILRYYRFAAKFDDFSDRYADVIRAEAANIRKLSIERVQRELLLTLRETRSPKIFQFIKSNGVFDNLDLPAYSSALQQNAPFEKLAYALFGYEMLTKTFRLPRTLRHTVKFIHFPPLKLPHADFYLSIISDARRPFIEHIMKGTKKAEGRVYSEKIRQLKPGKALCLHNGEAYVLCQITALNAYPTFEDMLLGEGWQNMVPFAKSFDDALEMYKSFPGATRVKKYGAVAIGVKVLNLRDEVYCRE